MEKLTKYPKVYNNPNKKFNDIINDLKNNSSYELIIGEVQSGKTWAIINLIKSALKNNFKFIFVLGGFNTFLWEQTIQRFEKELPKLKIHERIDEIDQMDFDKDNHLFVLLKSSEEMRKMYDNIHGTLKIRSADILIIDDEADYASINTGSNSDPSTINQYIHESYIDIKNSNHSNGGMISVTATPNAILVNSKHKINVNNAWVLKKNNDYTGVSFFNSLNNFYISLDNEVIKNIYKNHDIYIFTIFTWLLKTFLYYNDPISNKNSDLLIYVDEKINTHNNISNMIKNYFNDIFNNFEKYHDITNELIIFYKLSDKVNNIEFKLWLKNNFKNYFLIDPLIFNSENDKEKLYRDYNNNNYKFKIIIGGNILSRGFTFINLTTELFVYNSNNLSVDTLLQRCRWFGYRKQHNRYKYMNVVTNDDIIKKIKIAEKYNDIFEFNDTIHMINPNLAKQKLNELHNKYKNILGVTNNGKR